MYVRQSDLFVSVAIIMYIVFFALSPPEFVRTILSSPIGMSASFGLAVYIVLYHSKAIGVLLIVALLASMTQITEGFAAGSCSVDTIQSSTLFDGTDLTTVNDVANAGACGSACCENASCKAFTYNSQNKKCHLKNGNITSASGSANFSGARVTRTSTGGTTDRGSGGRTLNDINKDIDDLKKVGILESDNDNVAMKNLIRERNAIQKDPRAIPDGEDSSVDRPKNGGSRRSDPPADTKKETSIPKPTMSCNLENFASY